MGLPKLGMLTLDKAEELAKLFDPRISPEGFARQTAAVEFIRWLYLERGGVVVAKEAQEESEVDCHSHPDNPPYTADE